MEQRVVWSRVVRAVFALIVWNAAILAAPVASGAQSVTLEWNPSPDSTVTGYNIYYGVGSRVYTNKLDVGNVTNATITGLLEGATYYFAATAYNLLGIESDFSAEVFYTVPGLQVPNSPPTLNPLSNIILDEDAPLKTVALSGISGGSNETQNVTITASSSNTGLIPTPTISYAAPSATGSLSFTPLANANGSAVITVTVNDGQASNNVVVRTFTVTVRAVNDAPMLDAIANISLQENSGKQTVTLSGINSGAANELQTLAISATSSNPGLIPNPAVSYASPSATGSISFTPVAGASGEAIVTVTVNDGQASNSSISRSFVVFVNGAPFLSAISNQVIAVNSNTGPIGFTIGDPNTALAALVLSASSSVPALIPPNAIVFGGTGSNRTVTVTPAAGQSGTATITITVSDGSFSANRSFEVRVLAPPAPPSGLMIITNGSGTVSGTLNMDSPTLGKLYTLTALPAAGQQFAGWTGDLVSMEPTIQVVVSSNLLLQANFIPNPYRPVAGSYNGLFYEEDQVHAASAGAFTLALTTGGAYSGKLQLGKSKIKFTGKLGLDSRGTNVIVRKGATPLTLKLRFEDNGLSKELAGELTDGHWVAQLSGDRAGFDGVVHPAPYAGNYTVIFPGDAGGSGPEGHGYGMLRVDSSGKMRFAGKLADGTKVSQSAVLGLSGQWPLYVPLYSGAGALVSWITFADRERDDLNGGLAWVKLPGGKSRVYPQGFSMETQAVGSRYRILPGGGALNLAAGKVEFYGGNLPAAFTNYIAFGLKSKVSNQSVNALALSISAKNGTFKGKVTEPSSGRSFAFGGAILQKMNSGFGFLTGTDSTSSLELTQ